MEDLFNPLFYIAQVPVWYIVIIFAIILIGYWVAIKMIFDRAESIDKLREEIISKINNNIGLRQTISNKTDQLRKKEVVIVQLHEQLRQLTKPVSMRLEDAGKKVDEENAKKYNAGVSSRVGKNTPSSKVPENKTTRTSGRKNL